MKIEGSPGVPKNQDQSRNQYHGDPSLPSFHFPEAERRNMLENMMKNGISEIEANKRIDQQEADIINRIARAHMDKERKDSK